MYIENNNKSNHLDTLTIPEVAEKINAKDNETAKKWLIKIDALLSKRVTYSEAIKHYTDITPAEETERIKFESAAFHTGKRMSKVGRPTKKNKRDLNEFLGE